MGTLLLSFDDMNQVTGHIALVRFLSHEIREDFVVCILSEYPLEKGVEFGERMWVVGQSELTEGDK